MKGRKKRLLAGTACAALLAAAAVGGTLAYYTDQDQDVNVMTLGNVQIAQHEYERVMENGEYKTDTIDNVTSYMLQGFTQGKSLAPIVGDPSLPGDNPEYAGYDTTIVRMTQVDSYGYMQVFAGKNAQDKFVTVENTGKSDAFIRTLVAIECGTGDASLIGTGTRCVSAEGAATNPAPWISTPIGKITVDGNAYSLYEYVYRGASDVNRHVNGVLPAGDTTYPSLCQVYLKSAATNEDCEKLDGNGNGTLDILVFSQACQTAGFADAQTALDTAFGDITTTNHPWADGVELPTVIETASELNDLFTDDGDLVSSLVLAQDLAVSANETKSHSGYGATGVAVNGGTLDGAGKVLSVTDANGTWDSAVSAESGTIKNLTVNGAFRGIFMGDATGDVFIDNVTIDKVCYTFNSDAGSKEYGVYISNSTLNGWTSFSNVHKEVVFDNCTFGKGTGGYQYAFCRPYNSPSVFEDCVFEEGFEFDTSKTSDITFINCYYGDTLITAENAETLKLGETVFFYNGLNGITIK